MSESGCPSWKKAAEARQQSEESLGRGGGNGWNKEVVAERVGVGRKVLLLLLEKSSGGFVLYLVPWSGFVGGSMSLVFAGRRCPVFDFGLEALSSSSPLLALHVRGVT